MKYLTIMLRFNEADLDRLNRVGKGNRSDLIGLSMYRLALITPEDVAQALARHQGPFTEKVTCQVSRDKGWYPDLVRRAAELRIEPATLGRLTVAMFLDDLEAAGGAFARGNGDNKEVSTK